jgi:hypothetical protein
MSYNKKEKPETRGRKPIEANMQKILVRIFLQRYKIEKLGGIDKVQEIIFKHIETKLNDNGKETN